jgi:hypothetical protein
MKVEYSVLEEKDFEEAARLAAIEFARSEPMAKLQNLTDKDLFPVMLKLIQSTNHIGINIVAKYVANDEVVGIALGRPLNEDLPDFFSEECPALIPVFTLMEQLVETYVTQIDKKKSEQMIESIVIAVKKSARRQNIATQILKKCTSNALRLKYKYTFSCLSSIATQNLLLNKLKASSKGQIDVDKFEFNGDYPFTELKGHSVYLMETSLTRLRVILTIVTTLINLKKIFRQKKVK